MPRDQETLLDIVRFAQEILDLTKGMDEDTFAKNRPTQLAILYEIAVMGEAVKRLSPEFRANHGAIPWKEIAGMRDKVIHQYDRVKIAVVWQVIMVDIPFLLRQLEPLLPQP
ncbi:DUF86 domain-containing protein [Crocosphaera sp. XPORK-15E]|uniref:HepT-like ribonuclease domain-containing protein n=1 Tax=Crocosphaera sp. XPORK-15E TaxID=3110247 RepID=UPI002B1F72B4|nr:DUF86 domain-containing protein [Crocosphaera sp. XPORK-15E]MEA5536371.1 DUF86 domain-containing protein [Crocosphaera sp. XPORK-15E]